MHIIDYNHSEIIKVILNFLEFAPACKKSAQFIIWNTGLVSSGASLISWGEGASLALVGLASSDGVIIKMPYGVDVLHQPASYPIFSYWVGQN